MSHSIRFAAALTLAAGLWGVSAGATPANKAAMERYFGGYLSRELRACTTCHLPSNVKDPESLDDFPHNAFGAALAEAKVQLRREGKKHDLVARLALIASQDSDGDGVDNLTELLLGHNPGDPKDVPTAAELAQAPAKRAEFAAFLKSYRWQPFEPATRPAIPPMPSPGSRNPIDAFIADQLHAHGLTAAGQAPKTILLRRVYLDLIGLNPTPGEMAAFETDRSPDAYEKVVDELLADPRYGQRWARHWMDVWRYSDWAGYAEQVRDSQPFIWRWRDWIVESLNADKGYDRMVLEMLAADELCPNDDGALRATGFLVRNFKLLSREQWLEDTLNHTSRAFMGLTMHCAKCHDHKFDPITQEEYYRLRAVFEAHDVRTDPVPGVGDKKKDGLVRAFDKDLAATTFFFTRGDERMPDRTRGALAPGVPAALGGALQIKAIELPKRTAHPDRQPFFREALLADSRKTVEEARAKFGPVKDNPKLPASQRSEAEASLTLAKAKHEALAAVLRAEILEDAGRKGTIEWNTAATGALTAQRQAAVIEATANLIAAQNAADSARKKLDVKPPAATAATELAAAQVKIEASQKSLAAAATDLASAPALTYKPRTTDDYPERSTGRRLAFAQWLIDGRNPLTARVAVNHLWARHFGQGIVPSVDDFGRNGRPASHPALLDWLASELVANGWHMKPIHRLIVTSATYRQSSIAEARDLALDPDNTWLWRFSSRRMEAELVRDNVLYAGGQLDAAMGGVEIDHTQGLASKRRSLYLQVAPEKEVDFLKIFDGPNPNECYFRRPSVMPQQALALANSQLVVDEAKLLATAIAKQCLDQDDFIRGAFLHVLARPATNEELAACRMFLKNSKSSPDRGRENLMVVLFNHNDFVMIR